MAETQRRRRRIRHTSTDNPGPSGNPGGPGSADATPKPPPARPAGRPVPGPPATNPTSAGLPSAGPTSAGPTSETAPVHDPEPVTAAPGADDRETERGLRGLVGAGSSQVSAAAAMRARDANRPTEAELAAAERDLVIIRRGWVPRDPLSR